MADRRAACVMVRENKGDCGQTDRTELRVFDLPMRCRTLEQRRARLESAPPPPTRNLSGAGDALHGLEVARACVHPPPEAVEQVAQLRVAEEADEPGRPAVTPSAENGKFATVLRRPARAVRLWRTLPG
jgi:hypothetical protein